MPRTLLELAEATVTDGLGMWPWFALNDAEVAEVAALAAEL